MKTFKFTAILLMLAIAVAACNNSNGKNPEQGEKTQTKEEKSFVYPWPEGPKYYYGFEEIKVYLNEVPNKVVLGLDENYLSEIRLYLQKHDQIRNMELNNVEGQFCIYILTTIANTNVSAFMEDLKKLVGVKSVNPVYVWAGSITSEKLIIDEIVMLFKDHVLQQEIDEMHKKYSVEVKKKDTSKKWQILSVPVSADLLGITNAYHESGLVIYSHPNFIPEVVAEP